MPAGPTQMQSLFLDGTGRGKSPARLSVVATPAGQVVPLPLFCNNETNGAVG